MFKNELKIQLETRKNCFDTSSKKYKQENNFDNLAEYYKTIWKYCKKVLEPAK